MSWTWGAADPDCRAPRRSAAARSGSAGKLIGRIFWGTVSAAAGAFAVLAFTAAHREDTLLWGVLAAVGYIAQAQLKLQQRIDAVARRSGGAAQRTRATQRA